MHAPRRPKAYSYTRFSTPEQAKGDSATRQALAAQRWAEQHEVELDTELTFRDEGVSAFEGMNAERGALGEFLRAVERGDVPKNSWLLVESLDRISRQKPHRAARLIEDIIEPCGGSRTRVTEICQRRAAHQAPHKTTTRMASLE
jgi:DNA invertase Pin-like site-specific DNA recombinase